MSKHVELFAYLRSHVLCCKLLALIHTLLQRESLFERHLIIFKLVLLVKDDLREGQVDNNLMAPLVMYSYLYFLDKPQPLALPEISSFS